MEGDVEGLNAHLQSLKQRGANVLVLTGPSDSTVCQQLLGSDSLVRRRLHVRTRGKSNPVPSTDPERFGLIEVPGETVRSALHDTHRHRHYDSATEYGVVEPQTPHRTRQSLTPDRTSDAPAWFSRPEQTWELATLARHIHDHVTRFEAAHPAPGEIRLCFDSLDTLVDDTTELELSRFLHVVSGRVRAARAIAHYHLSASISPKALSRFEGKGLFDATVETRHASDGPQQRWTLHGRSLQTDWLRLD